MAGLLRGCLPQIVREAPEGLQGSKQMMEGRHPTQAVRWQQRHGTKDMSRQIRRQLLPAPHWADLGRARGLHFTWHLNPSLWQGLLASLHGKPGQGGGRSGGCECSVLAAGAAAERRRQHRLEVQPGNTGWQYRVAVLAGGLAHLGEQHLVAQRANIQRLV